MQVILTRDVKGQGKKGQMVNVSDGYARNYLLPRGLAEPATKSNINVMKGKQESLEYKKKVELEEANAIAEKMKEIKVVLKAKAGENGKLFGSVTNIDIANKISEEKGIEIDKRKIDLKKAIKEAGIYDVKIKLYGSVEANVKIEVVV